MVVTFIYTRCPLPTFCPLMDRHFATIQTAIKGDPALKNVRLVSVSFDPATDTPPVLKKHAAELNADPARWTFLTGDRDDIDRFAARFGVSVARARTTSATSRTTCGRRSWIRPGSWRRCTSATSGRRRRSSPT